ncbi:unnamed protein product [Prorocentrum cordatum]|uniref:Uncharacterized protein n=1 Tax=Prorocentrum cordatum TaxID=2364126 RepID=A0ABN9XNP8_9DINO|nr:unnamed protein product [Polarella glacialis]
MAPMAPAEAPQPRRGPGRPGRAGGAAGERAEAVALPEPRAAALLELLRGGGGPATAAGLDGESVRCTLEAVLRQLALGRGAEAGGVRVPAGLWQLEALAAELGRQISRAKAGPGHAESAEPSGAASAGTPDRALRGVGEAAQARWQRALSEAARWKEAELAELSRGPACPELCAQLSAQSEATLAAAMLLLQDGAVPRGPPWRAPPDLARAPAAPAEGGAAVRAVLGALRGGGGGLQAALGPLDLGTARCVLEAAALRAAAAPPAGGGAVGRAARPGAAERWRGAVGAAEAWRRRQPEPLSGAAGLCDFELAAAAMAAGAAAAA